MRGWAPPDVVSVSPLPLAASGEQTVATIAGCFWHSADVHLVALTALTDGATVRLYATADDVESLVAEATVDSTSLPTPASGGRQGLIVGVRHTLARTLRVTIEPADGSVAIANAGRINLAAWGQ